MYSVSIVIITRNEAANIAACIACAKLIGSDIIVVDAASSDDTVAIARAAGARWVPVQWENFGSSRNAGAEQAKNNWIFALDADERIDETTAFAVGEAISHDIPLIYGFKRKSFFAGKKIRFGTWGRDRVFRLYDRRFSHWDTSPVHERLRPVPAGRKMLEASIVHYPVRKAADFQEKIQRYAVLTAEKYLQQNKRSNALKRWLSPYFAFAQSYLFLLGFLDGREGLTIARQLATYTRLKYTRLAHLQKERFAIA